MNMVMITEANDQEEWFISNEPDKGICERGLV